MPVQSNIANQTCRRCGICCSKGGPALHAEDREKVESGKIPLKCLFTIRKGEPAYDNIKGRVAPAVSDIIKIKSAADNDSTCMFLDQAQVACTIYGQRPIECRLLSCRDTREIVAFYEKERLGRYDLLSKLAGLSDLVAEHQKRCDYGRVAQWAEAIKKTKDGESIRTILELIRYDLSLRKVTVERTRLDPEMLEFLFGRPLSVTIRLFQLKLIKNGAAVTIVPYI